MNEKVYKGHYTTLLMEEIKCPYCSKIFKGLNKKQVESQLLIHKINRHADKIEIREKK